ncbi:hypothetical protein U1Q18_018360 [Sarracenia purpurea var. burkii]
MMTDDYVPHASTAALEEQSPWQSPVPYLFGGLVAMLGLIAFALLILACSFWKLSGYLDAAAGDNNSAERDDVELGEPNSHGKIAKLPPPIFEEKILVIMAGQEKPTFLATPISTRNSSFGSNGSRGSEKADKPAGDKEGNGNQVRTGNTETHDNSNQVL